jgi:small subunit ribosomal protein S16
LVRIRLKRIGKRQQAFYRVVVVDGRDKRDGRVLEDLGFYQPWLKNKKSDLRPERYLEWVKKGAVPTPTVMAIFKRGSKAAAARAGAASKEA